MNGFDIEIQYSNKIKLASLEVWPGNVVKVFAPVGFDEQEVKKIISKKTKWIIEKQRLIRDIPSWREREFVSGESFPILGKEYRIKVIQAYGETQLKDDRLFVPVAELSEESSDLIKFSLIKWYKQFAFEKITERAAYYAELLGVTPSKISLKDYEGRWGSCTPSGELIFNWQIVTLPKGLFEYVVAHEVCHLVEMGHGKEFNRAISRLGCNKEEIETTLRYYRNVF